MGVTLSIAEFCIVRFDMHQLPWSPGGSQPIMITVASNAVEPYLIEEQS